MIQQLDSDLSVLVITLNSGARSNRSLNEILSSDKHKNILITDLSLRKLSRVGQFFQILQVRRKLREYFRQMGRSILVVGDDWCPVERSAVAYAKEQGIPTVLIQDGALEANWLNWALARRRKQNLWIQLVRQVLRFGNLLPPLSRTNCDYLAVWGEYTRNEMIGRGVPSESIYVTGAPRFDEWVSRSRVQSSLQQKGKAKHQLLFVALLLSNFSVGISYEADCHTMESLEIFARSDPSWDVVVRPHPSEDPEDYQRLFKSMNLTRLKLEPSVPLSTALNDCDVLLTHFSTVGIEAMILGKPVLCLDVNDDLEAGLHIAYKVEKAVPVLNNLDGLSNWINKLLNDSTTQAELAQWREIFLAKYLGYADAASSARVARLLEGLFV